MIGFIDPQELADALAYGLQAYVVMLIVSSIVGMYIWRFVEGRRGTFVAVVLGLLNVFFIVFYGSNFMMHNYWNWGEALSDSAMLGMSLLMALVLILLPVIPLRIWLNETKSPLRMEYENLKDEEMSPIDVRRKKHMAKRQARGAPKPPHQI